MTPYRILVTGSRDWPKPAAVRDALWRISSDMAPTRRPAIIHGACPTGPDWVAAMWTRSFGKSLFNATEEAHPADWRPGGVLDKSAGFRRNAEMVQLGADLCLAFIKDGSRGASHTAALAEQAGIPVRRFTA